MQVMGNPNQALHSTRIDIPANARSKTIEILNQTLASTLDLKTQVKQAHWNVKGMDFYQLHELFDDMATELEAFIDLFAERITALGGTALGTARIAAAGSEIPEYPLDIFDGKSHVTALADRYAPYAKICRDGIAATDDLGDADTADLYTEVSRAIDKRLWFLEAHLHKETPVASTNGETPEAKPANGKKPKSKNK
jgi:starvation-inducible DNA-binding protein